MNETLVTVVGNVATQPDFRESANGAAVSRFRLAATVRRWDRGARNGPTRTRAFTPCGHGGPWPRMWSPR
ncbi:single-stranded DNA-binding protein [Streptomyces syringium]|uniref:single-stranded DNA-binding protein n=1 Tax=Streptomyces syringium TaxID=76729 RepID=UPI003D90684E